MNGQRFEDNLSYYDMWSETVPNKNQNIKYIRRLNTIDWRHDCIFNF